ncbi:MAG: glycosyltransferase [Candidatus Calescibacterium sp.]|nr:glycosyltransferase [Candidatus Calescibacterium sp.]MDW8132659.1 glycosyltransferase [Candidatus Calescibacterium sp.]
MITIVFFGIELGDNKILGPNVVFHSILKNINPHSDFRYVFVVKKNSKDFENFKDYIDFWEIKYGSYLELFIEVNKIKDWILRKNGGVVKLLYPKPFFLPLNIEQYAFLYDLPFEKLYQGKTLDSLKKEFLFKSLFWRKLKKIFTISYSSFQDINRVLMLNNLDWLYLGVDTNIFRPIPENDKRRALFSIFSKMGIDFVDKYFFAPLGKIWYRKNALNLILSFKNFCKYVSDKVYLIITANNLDSNDKYVRSVLENSDDRVVFLDNVSNDELVALYNGCLGVILPSFYEGFGLPLLEALACKKNILFSNIKVFNEIYPGNIYTFDPLSVEDITKCMLKFYNEKDYLKSDRILQEDIVKKFSWKEMVDNLLKKMKE